MDPPAGKAGKGMRKGFPVYGSRSCRGSRLVRELQQRVEQRTEELHDLTAQNNSLKQRQELLFTSIGQQADVLHYASKIIELLQQTSSPAPADCAHAQATAAALVFEHKAQQLLSELQATHTSSSSSGNTASPSSSAASEEADPTAEPDAAAAAADVPASSPAASEQQPYTTQLLREVFTQERVLQAQAMGLQELVGHFRSLTFRMAFQLGLPASRAALLSGSLEATLHEYACLDMLCHIACPKALWQVVTLNMETLEQAMPGPDHWEAVSAKMEPTPEQVCQLAMGFEVYSRKRSGIIAELEQLVQQVHLMVWPQAGKEAAAAAAAATVAQVAAAAAPTPADLQQLPAPSFSSNCSSGTAANVDGSSGSSELMAAAAGSSSSGGNELLARQQSLQSLLVNLKASEQLLQLLKDVDQRVQMLMTIECNLIFSWINAMDKRRMALAVVESYPFMVMPIPLCELAAQQHALMQEEAAAATAAKKGAAAKRQQSAD